jgi:hypothetical protein
MVYRSNFIFIPIISNFTINGNDLLTQTFRIKKEPTPTSGLKLNHFIQKADLFERVKTYTKPYIFRSISPDAGCSMGIVHLRIEDSWYSELRLPCLFAIKVNGWVNSLSGDYRKL